MTIILGIAIFFVVLYIGVELFSKPLFAFFAKAIASIGFIIVGLYSAINVMYGFVFIVVIGLLFGMIGDLILALRPLRPKEENETIINAGIFAFSFGHFVYLLFLTSIHQLTLFAILFSIGITILVITMSYLMKFQMGKTRIPSYIYSLLIFLMIGQTISLASIHDGSLGLVMLMLGAILFGISDLVLAPIYYKAMNQKYMIAINLITYYAAQILIAYSLYFL
ncbi:MAG: lysoplasmalogenase family protein [Acholeplasmataceae bacterium]|nr:lysoplasmalogenase family protein [Acholeplasmataceae bacterium]